MSDPLEHLKAALADRYTMERELGSGGMATVYLAEDQKLHRKVAVKVLRPELAAALGPDRFLQEIDIAAKLNHPHILGLFDCGEADGFLYYVMPHVEGESLRDKLSREGELPIGEAVRILRDVVDALSHAHKHGVVHRDIKPDNVLLSERHALVTDFGVAKAVSEATGAHKLTTEGVALGTPAYMSPEQAAADKHIDHRADIYAVGALAYEVLTGRPPFTGTTPQEVLAAHVTKAVEPVTEHRGTVPPALAQLVMKCLEKKPADRWQSAEELLPQLEALATPSGGVTPTDTRPVAATARGRRWVVPGAVALVVAAAAVIGTALWLPRGTAAGLDPNRVLVVAYVDEIGSDVAPALGRWAQDHIIEVLTEAGFAEVVDPLTALAVAQNVADAGVTSGPGDVLALAEEAQAGTVVSGSYYAEGDSLYVHTRITDARNGRLLGTVPPIAGSVGAGRDLVARLAEQVIVSLAPLLDRQAESFEPVARPATYEAYVTFGEALEAYLRSEMTEAGSLFEQALAIDPTYTRARLWAAQTYALNSSTLAKADTLLSPLRESQAALSRYERCRLDFVTGIRRWNGPEVLDAARCMAEAAPGSDDAKRELAAFTASSGRPAEGLTLLKELDPNRGLMRYFRDYWSWLGRAAHVLGDYEQELEAAREGRRRYPENLSYALQEARALAALGRLDDVAAQIEAVRSSALQDRLGRYLVYVSVYLETHGHSAAATEVVEEAIAWARSRPTETSVLALSLYHARRWEEARELLETLVEEYPRESLYLAALGWLAARRGDRAEALRISEELGRCDRQRCMGWPGTPTVYRAEIAALLGNRDEAVGLLREVLGVSFPLVPETNPFSGPHYHFLFESLRGYPPFEELIRPKG